MDNSILDIVNSLEDVQFSFIKKLVVLLSIPEDKWSPEDIEFFRETRRLVSQRDNCMLAG